MIKQLILLFHVFGVFFYQLIFSGDITVNQQLPSTMQSGTEVVVEIIVHKNDVTGFAKVQQEIPEGFSAEAIETKGATFSFKENQIKYIWMALPSEEEFTISYKLKADAALTGDFTFGGKFSFITNSERQNIEIAKSTISVSAEMAASNTSSESEEGNQENTNTEVVIPVITPDSETESTPEVVVTPPPTTIKLINVNCNRTIEETEPSSYMVTINIKKEGIEGFAKIGEKVPDGFTASEGNSNGGVFSFKEQQVKILWMAIPKEEDFVITYKLTANENTSNGSYQITGEFSYLESDATRKYTIDGSSIILNVPKKIEEPIAIEEPVIEEEEEEEEVVAQTEKRVSSTPNPETGVTYKIQVGAGHQTVSTNYFSSKFNLQDNVSTINHEGWIKYLVGSYTKYKEARDKRETVRRKVKTAFVTAYNTGKRITVQEALMISNQKWYK